MKIWWMVIVVGIVIYTCAGCHSGDQMERNAGRGTNRYADTSQRGSDSRLYTGVRERSFTGGEVYVGGTGEPVGLEVPPGWRMLKHTEPDGECQTVLFRSPQGMTFAHIPAGSFEMGSPESEFRRDSDERLHRVTLTQGFFMQVTEVTQYQWMKFSDENPSHFRDKSHLQYPVENVSWEAVQSYIDDLNASQDEVRYRLPTEAEWEYACRAGTTTPFYQRSIETKGNRGYSKALDTIAWHHRNSDSTTHPVATKKPNAWGLYDMHGNVWEWCADWVGEYPVTPAENPTGPESGRARMRRGGSWNNYPSFARAANRSWHDPHGGAPDTGFRLVAVPRAAESVEEPVATSGTTDREPDDEPCIARIKQGETVHVRTGIPNSADRPGNVLVERTLPDVVRVDESFDYTIKVHNRTNCPIKRLVLTEHPGAKFSVRDTDPQARSVRDGGLQWEISPLPAGRSEVFHVTGIATGPGELEHCATAEYALEACARTRAVAPELQLVKDMPDESLLCDDVPIRLTVSNVGTGTARDVTVVDTLPEGLAGQDGQREFSFSAGSLEEGESRDFEIMAKPVARGSHTNTATATEEGGIQVEARGTIDVRAPELKISKTGRENEYVGRPFEYRITVRNTGDAPAKNVVIRDEMPGGMDFVEASHKVQQRRGEVVWNVPVIEPQREETRTITLRTETAGDFTNTVTASADCADSVTDTARISVRGITALLLEVRDNDDPLQVGETGEYVVEVTNQGTRAATNVRVTCELEENMRYVSSTGPTEADVEEGVLSFRSLSELPAGETVTWTVRVRARTAGDVRFKAEMRADQLQRVVSETEATTLY